MAKRWFIGVCVLAGSLSMANTAYAKDKACFAVSNKLDVSYSATQKMSYRGMDMSSKINYTPHKQRMEMSQMQGMAIITDYDKGQKIQLNPMMSTYQVSEISQESSVGDVKILTCEKVGKETVSGMSATKYKVIGEHPENGKMGGYTWIEEHGIVVKSKMVTKAEGQKVLMEIQMTDLDFSPQPAELFVPPEHYQKQTAGAYSGALGSMLGGRGQQGASGDGAQGDDAAEASDEGDSTPRGLGGILNRMPNLNGR